MEAFDGVCHDEGINSATVEYSHRKDERNRQIRNRPRSCWMVLGGTSCQGNKTGAHRQTAKNKKLSATDSITDQRTYGSDSKAGHIICQVVCQESALSGDSNSAK